MSTLADTYSLGAGVRHASPDMPDAFFPLEHDLDKVILIHSFGGKIVDVDTPNGKQPQVQFPAKIYDYYGEVVDLIRPAAEKAGYRVYQIGAPREPILKNTESLVGRTSLLQCAYLVRRCALLIGNDSMWAHVRGAAFKPLVAVYGSTSKPHFPHWRDDAKTVLIEPHRCGNKPSYLAAENPKTINTVPPEQIANAALSLLDLPAVSRQTLSIGQLFNNGIIEVIPDVVVDPRVGLPVAPVFRMDLHFNEDMLLKNLQIRKGLIITNKEIDLKLLSALRQNIEVIRIEIDKVSPEWVKAVKRTGIKVAVMAVEKDEAEIVKMRLKFYDALQPTGFDLYKPATIDDWKAEVVKYMNKPFDETLKVEELSFRTNKFTLAGGKVYLSRAHWERGIATPDTTQNVGKVIDIASFWEDAVAHMTIYKDTTP